MRGGPLAPGEQHGGKACTDGQERGEPEEGGFGVHRGAQADEVTVSRHHPGHGLVVRVAACDPLTDQAAQVFREVGVAVLDAFVLADEAAELAANGLGPQLL